MRERDRRSSWERECASHSLTFSSWYCRAAAAAALAAAAAAAEQQQRRPLRQASSAVGRRRPELMSSAAAFASPWLSPTWPMRGSVAPGPRPTRNQWGSGRLGRPRTGPACWHDGFDQFGGLTSHQIRHSISSTGKPQTHFKLSGRAASGPDESGRVTSPAAAPMRTCDQFVGQAGARNPNGTRRVMLDQQGQYSSRLREAARVGDRHQQDS
jgi:hypothetical protein